MKTNLVTNGGTLDGEAITDVAQDGVCGTIFTTATGALRIDWSGQPNSADRDEGGKRLMALVDPKGAEHVLAMRTGDDAVGAAMGVGVLTSSCGRR